MSAITQDRNTAMKDGELFEIAAAAGKKLPAGTMVCTNVAGFATPGATAVGLAYIGRADNAVDNTAGTDGATAVLVRRGKAFKWANDGTDPVKQANVGRACFIVDNQTVAATNGANTRSQAGTVIGIDADGVWVV